MDQAHKQAASAGTGLGLLTKCVLAMQDDLFQAEFYEAMVLWCACPAQGHLDRLPETEQKFDGLTQTACPGPEFGSVFARIAPEDFEPVQSVRVNRSRLSPPTYLLNGGSGMVPQRRLKNSAEPSGWADQARTGIVSIVARSCQCESFAGAGLKRETAPVFS